MLNAARLGTTSAGVNVRSRSTNAELLGWRGALELEADPFALPFGRVDAGTWNALRPLVEWLDRDRVVPTASGLQKRIGWLCRLLKLTALDAEILSLAVRSAWHGHKIGAIRTGYDAQPDPANVTSPHRRRRGSSISSASCEASCTSSRMILSVISLRCAESAWLSSSNSGQSIFRTKLAGARTMTV